jgi:hypothetical protein
MVSLITIKNKLENKKVLVETVDERFVSTIRHFAINDLSIHINFTNNNDMWFKNDETAEKQILQSIKLYNEYKKHYIQNVL